MGAGGWVRVGVGGTAGVGPLSSAFASPRMEPEAINRATTAGRDFMSDLSESEKGRGDGRAEAGRAVRWAEGD